MKRFQIGIILCCISILLGAFFSGCSDSEKTLAEIAVGNWTQLRNRAYILLITNPKGGWTSSVRIADVTSKIVSSKGTAKGTWHIENNQMIFTVSESDIEKIWEKNATLFFDIVLLTPSLMQLKDESGWISEWKQTSAPKAGAVEEKVELVLPMGPVVVNLNKNRSNDKDRYLCMDINLVLKELMPDQEPPPVHPRVRDATIVFLSSLVFNDVKDFDRIKYQGKTLVDVINPYMESMIEKIDIEHVIVANNIDKVDEFIIEHTMTEETPPEDGAQEDGEKPPEEPEESEEN